MNTHPISGQIWLALGFLGQFLFFSRFVVQLIASEKKRESVIPVSFWYLSIAGAAILFAYALHKRDPVFYTGSVISLFIYIRNLILIKRKSKKLSLENTV